MKIKKSILALRDKLKDTSYAKYIRGKRVAIIGPAKTVEGKSEGEKIDSYDIAIRFNTTMNYMPFSEKLISDIGKTTTALYLCPSSVFNLITKMSWLDARKTLLDAGVKFIVYQNGNKHKKYDKGEYVYDQYLQPYLAYMKLSKYKLRAYYSNSSMDLLSDWLSKHANTPLVARTGFLSIFDSVLHGASEIMIRGMTFYHAGGHMFRPVAGELDPVKQHQLLDCPHDSIKEIELFKMIIELFDTKFDMDDNLKQLIFKAKG